jgi:SAM-dependent methyltransferase
VDLDAAALSGLTGLGELIEADLEGAPWPLKGRQFGVVIVTNYLWRPLFNELLGALEPGGLLLYETFAQGQAAFGRPSRDDFLLQPGELLQRCQGLRVLAYEEGVMAAPKRCVQRVAAWRALAESGPRDLEPEQAAAGAIGSASAAPG